MQELKEQISAMEKERVTTATANAAHPSPAGSTQGATASPAKAERDEEHKSSLDLYGFVMADTGTISGKPTPIGLMSSVRPSYLHSETSLEETGTPISAYDRLASG